MSSLAFIAGIAATVIFAGSMLPMLVKARRTRDLSSYSLGNIVLANLGNVVQSVYVLSLPPGPIWVLHGFYAWTTALMLGWYLRYGRPVREPTHAAAGEVGWIARRERGRAVPSVSESLIDRSAR